MRRIVALLLLVLLPLQAIWAAAAPYCQHEDEVASHHIGHHLPEHPHAAPTASDAADGPDAHGSPDDLADEAGSTHGHCHVCHGGTVLAHEVRLVQVLATSAPPVPALPQGLPAPPGARPERPQWPVLA